MTFFETRTTTSTIGGFDSSIRTHFIKKIRLPKMDNYPLDYFSQTRCDFLAAISQYPALENVFNKLQKLQLACKGNNLLDWQTSCLSRNLKQKTAYVQVGFSCTKEKQEQAIALLDSLGIF